MSSSSYPLPLVDGVLYIDNSSLESFTCCPRQSEYQILRKRELAKDRIALSFGEAFHTVLDYLYRRYGTSYRSTEDNLDVIKFASSLILPTPEDDYRTTSYLVNAVAKYIADYPAEPFTIENLLGGPTPIPAIEVPFMYPLGTIESPVYGTIRVVWTGRIDLIYNSRGKIGIMDHKTTSIMGASFFTEFEFAHQMYGYVAATEYLLKTQLSEFSINGLGCRKPTRTGVAYEFSRHIVPITRPLLEEWHVDCLNIVSNFIHYAESGYFPKHTKWCMAKYGACGYRAVCSMDPAMRDTVLSTSEFRTITWNPLVPKVSNAPRDS